MLAGNLASIGVGAIIASAASYIVRMPSGATRVLLNVSTVAGGLRLRIDTRDQRTRTSWSFSGRQRAR